MKTLEQLAKRKAYQLFFSTSNILSHQNALRVKKYFDMRTNLDQKAIVIFMQLVNSVDKLKIKQLKKERAQQKRIETNNILQNKLLLDFQKNKGLTIYDNHLSDGYRNHWAKNGHDLKVLQVLKKNYPNLSK